MNIADFLEEIDKLRLHKHQKIGASLKKPLFLLLLISRIENKVDIENRFLFHDIERDLDILIKSFGGRTASSKPEQPFNYLASSMIWELKSPYGSGLIPDNKVSKKIMRDSETYGYLNKDVYDLLRSDERNRAIASSFILDKFWPETVQTDIRNHLGLPELMVLAHDKYRKKKRDPAFAYGVLEHYDYRCAVCGFSSGFNGVPFGIDAAHIMWHAYDGPDSLENGLALCKLHHWALDRGVYTLMPETLEIKVSPYFKARDEVSHLLIENLTGERLKTDSYNGPSGEFIKWHQENVYVG